MSHEILAKLSLTEKGQLQYGSASIIQSRFPKDKQKFMQLEPQIFNLSEVNVVLENCEESAFAEESRNVKRTLVKTSLDYKDVLTNDNTQNNFSVNLINTELECNMLVNNCNISNKRIMEEKINAKVRLFESQSTMLSNLAKEKHIHFKRKRFLKYDSIKERLQQHIIENEEAAKEIKHQSIKEFESRNKILLTRIEEAEKRQQQKLKQGKERLQNAELVLNKVEQSHALFLNHFSDSKKQSLQSNPLLLSIQNQFNELYKSTLSVMQKCRMKEVMELDELSVLSVNCELLHTLLNEQSVTLEQLCLKEEEKEKQLQEELKIKQQEEERIKKSLQAEKEKQLADHNPENAFPKLPKELVLSVSRSAYHRYNELKQILEQYEVKKKKFVSDKANIKLVMAINKGISVPLSSITSRSGSDLKNKLNDLENVLKGINIKVNNQNVVLNKDAIDYAYLCMAQKFVKQAEGQVSSNHSAAFCLALVLVGVWSSHELLGKLVLAQLQQKCPFVVPWYVPQLTDQSEVDYNKKRGYLYSDDGIVEKQDKYLSRISGLVRMYAALIQSPLPPNKNVHPHGVTEGWKWVSRMLNLEPWPDVTATVLFDFLEVTGHALMLSYGKQFQKLLYALCHDYFPKIKEVSDGGGGPLKRLQMFLEDSVKAKTVPKPEGHLDSSFWSTYHHAGVVGS